MSDRRRKLTDEQVAAIRAGRGTGKSMLELARQFKVSTATVWFIVKGLSRKE